MGIDLEAGHGVLILVDLMQRNMSTFGWDVGRRTKTKAKLK